MSADRFRSTAAFLVYAFVVATPFSLAAGSILGVTVLVTGAIALALHAPARAAIPRWVFVGVLGMVLWSALATATADPYPAKWLTWAKELWIKLFLLSATGLMVFARTRVDRVLVVYVAVGALVAVFGILQYLTGSIPFRDHVPPMRGDRWEIEAFYNHHLTYGGHVVVLWLLALARVVFGGTGARTRGLVHRGFGVSTLVLLSLGLYWSYARSPQIGALAGFAVLLLVLPWKRRLVAAVVLAVTVVAALVSPTMRERYVDALDLSTEQTRLLLWQSSIDGIADRPWTGFGPGNFREMMLGHEVPGDYDSRAHAHNDYLMQAVNGGIPMLGFGLLFAGALIVFLWRWRRRPDGSADWIVVGALAAHVALLAAGLFQVFQTDDEVEFTLYFTLACALAHVAQRRRVETGG